MCLWPHLRPTWLAAAARRTRLRQLQRARGARITCPPPGINRDSPALAPGRTFRPELIIVQLRSAFEKGLAPRSPLRAWRSPA